MVHVRFLSDSVVLESRAKKINGGGWTLETAQLGKELTTKPEDQSLMPQDPHVGRREATVAGSPLTSMCAPWLVLAQHASLLEDTRKYSKQDSVG